MAGTATTPASSNVDDEEIMYQVDEEDDMDGFGQSEAIPKILHLDIRGTRLDLDGETLVNLPGSLLVAMFPNGLSWEQPFDDDDGSLGRSDDDDGYTRVDFDPRFFIHVLDMFRKAQSEYAHMADDATPLPSQVLTKQYIVMLQEELEYFCIPSQTLNEAQLAPLKLAAGQHLCQQDAVFDALERNFARADNAAENHLIDMLCDAGFARSSHWGYRALEPMRTCVISVSLVRLNAQPPVCQVAMAQKFMLFWRKPARKCWWDVDAVDLEGHSLRLWSRRTWTLELALV